MKKLLEDYKKTIVFLGKILPNREVKPCATGFLVQIESVFFLVTAKHVVAKVDNSGNNIIQDNNIGALSNTKDSKVSFRLIKNIKDRYNVDWIFHSNPLVDIAMIPFELSVESDDVKVIPKTQFLKCERLFETYEIFFMSYQPGINDKFIKPVVRSGTISLINNDETLFIDSSAFPGNSGSPLFLKPSPIRFDSKGISIGSDDLGGKFIGIIGSYFPYQEVAISTQTGRPRVIFEENTGLSKVWTVDYLEEIIEKKEIKDILNKFKIEHESEK